LELVDQGRVDLQARFQEVELVRLVRDQVAHLLQPGAQLSPGLLEPAEAHFVSSLPCLVLLLACLVLLLAHLVLLLARLVFPFPETHVERATRAQTELAWAMAVRTTEATVSTSRGPTAAPVGSSSTRLKTRSVTGSRRPAPGSREA